MKAIPFELLLHINRQERKKLNSFKNLARNEELRPISLEYISKHGLSLIFKLSYQDTEFKALCESSELYTHWQTQLIKRVGEFAVLQPPCITPFSALMGYFLYHFYNRCLTAFDNEITTMGNKLLYEACRTNIFVALKSYLDTFTQQLTKNIFDAEELKTALEIAENIAILHWTPGCLEAVSFYLQVGCAIQKKDSPFPEGFDSKIYFIQGFAHLLLAEKLAKIPDSTRAFKNGWADKTFTEVYGSEYTSWEQARFKLIEFYGLSRGDYENAAKIAATKFKEYTSKSLPNDSSDILENSNHGLLEEGVEESKCFGMTK